MYFLIFVYIYIFYLLIVHVRRGWSEMLVRSQVKGKTRVFPCLCCLFKPAVVIPERDK